MVNEKLRDVLTTGQVARICNVAPRTVSKWFDSGVLRGYRIPGSKDRRIPLQSLIRFMKAHGIPLNGLETGHTRVLVVDDQTDLAGLLARRLGEDGPYDVRTAGTAIEAGMLLHSFHPHVALLDVSLPDVNAQTIFRLVAANPDLAGLRLVAMGGSISEGEAQVLAQQGFVGVLRKPFDVRQAMRAIEDALAVVV
jgi:excisionase family DNA binding protein